MFHTIASGFGLIVMLGSVTIASLTAHASAAAMTAQQAITPDTEAAKGILDLLGVGLPVVTVIALVWAWTLWRAYQSVVAERNDYQQKRIAWLEERQLGLSTQS